MAAIGFEIGRYQDRPDWPKMWPSPLVGTGLILAIRTAKWPVRKDQHLSDRELDEDIELMSSCETIFSEA